MSREAAEGLAKALLPGLGFNPNKIRRFDIRMNGISVDVIQYDERGQMLIRDDEVVTETVFVPIVDTPYVDDEG